MSDNFQHIDVDSDEYLDAPKALRDAYKQLKARYTDTVSDRDALKGQLTATALSDVLKGFKNPERVKRDLLAEGVDPLNTEAVQSWLGSNGDDYAKGEGAPSTPSPTSVEEAAEVAAHQQLQAARSLTQPADMSKVEAAITALGPNATPEEVVEAFRKAGV